MPCAERSRWRALTCHQLGDDRDRAGPDLLGLLRHQAGVRM